MCLSKIIKDKSRKRPSIKNFYYCLMYQRENNTFVSIYKKMTLYIKDKWYDAKDGLFSPGQRIYTNSTQYYVPYFHLFATIKDCELYRKQMLLQEHAQIVRCKAKQITNIGIQNGLFTIVARHRKIIEIVEKE